ncbi:MAG TPA: glycosyltransferase family 9 protein [Propionibacteriaceae bacterium]|nr:glycosyltransferase family 9 protein [Propionibacteriaceae bacterium]
MTRPVALALRALGLGDFLTGLPALQLLRRALPEHDIVLAAPTVFAPIIPLVPAVDRLEPTGELMPVDRRYLGVDVAVDLHGKGPASRRLLVELEPTRLVGFGDPGAGFTGPPWYAAEHEVKRWCRLVTTAFGIDDAEATSVVGAVAVPDVEADTGLTVVHPGAAAESRRWPAERFAEVAAELRRRGHRVVITGGHAERSLAEAVSEASGAPTLLGLSIPQLMSVVASARLVVCGDTGVAHVASNYRTPSVVLFGPVSPALWGPPKDPSHLVIFHGDGAGNPHGEEPDAALLRITVSEVLDGVQQVTRALEARPQPAASGQGRR